MSEDKIYPTMVIRSQAEAIELLEKENYKLQARADKYKCRIDKAIEYMKYNATSNYFDKEKNMFRREIDLLEILKGENNG